MISPKNLRERLVAPKSATRAPVTVFGSLLLFTLFAGDFWRNLISWPGYFALAAVLAAGSLAILIATRPRIQWKTIPKALLLFLLLASVSIAWSAYPGASALGVLAQLATTAGAALLAYCLTWSALLAAFSRSLQWILALSLLFELVVSTLVREPVLPLTPLQAPPAHIPSAFYWSRGLLFHGGQIQGIVGNSNLLAMIALLALIVFGIQLADRTVRRTTGFAWVAIALLTLALTRSSTVLVAALVTTVLLAFALWTRHTPRNRRAPVYLTAGGLLMACVVLTTGFTSRIPELLGKSEDLTGRIVIWHKVTELAQQRPVFGWGWVSYWAPWSTPFKDLAERSGVTYLQAHNAWLDVWMQLGVIGLATFAVLVFTSYHRSWTIAAHESGANTQQLPALSLLPLLLLTALIVQSLAESRIIIEGGWTLLAVIAIKTKQVASE
ncbi:O-antigen ligase family protein [Leifsonia aquatica]|uniref:O-antigen ligase family protein n=1 Tax=Leifsonia aquatica TaxID=144185 RepID=UPI00380058C2